MAQSQVMTKRSTGGIEALPELKGIAAVRAAPGGHWVGDGFPVRTVFGYDNAEAVSPFLLLDYAGPFHFPLWRFQPVLNGDRGHHRGCRPDWLTQGEDMVN